LADAYALKVAIGQDTAALVALLRRRTRPWAHYADLVEEAGSAVAILEAERREEHPQLFASDAPPDLDSVAKEIEAWEAEGMRLLTVLDPDYPDNLRGVHDRPPLVFIRGSLLPRDSDSVAVVGTRQATARGIEHAKAIAGALADADFTVVSGMATGIDAAAHAAALDRGCRTLAVVGTGLRQCYPAAHRSLQERIVAAGAVVSQFWPDQPPTKTTFPLRNATMSGLALATVVVEASQTSGARMQARLALEHGRPVFLLASLLEHEWARGYAQRPGTYVVDDPGEIVERVSELNALDTLVA
jgi:DNA processing protein